MFNARRLNYVFVLCVTAFVTQSVRAQKMYWTDSSSNKIQRANLDGTQVEDLISYGSSEPHGIALDLPAGKMYWTTSQPNRIRRANLDGSQVEVLVHKYEEVGYPRSIALDISAGKMYWVSGIDSIVRRANLDGSSVELLIEYSSALRGRRSLALDLDNGKMYLTFAGIPFQSTQQDGSIVRANLDGSALEIVVTGLLDPTGIALDLDAGYMYWTDGAAQSISRSTLNGNDIEEIVTVGTRLPLGLAIDIEAEKTYWTETEENKIHRANYDGSEVEDLVFMLGLENPSGIVLDVSDCLTDFACSDGSVCTDDVCINGACAFNANMNSCDDENVCTDDVCIGGICVRTPNNMACDDGNQCTNNDACIDGVCLGQNRVGSCDGGRDCPFTVCIDGRCQEDASTLDGCATFSLLVTEVNGIPCPSCPTANLPQEEVSPGDQITLEAFISDWGGANNDRRLEFFQWELDTSTLTKNGIGLTPADFLCDSDSDCHHGFTTNSCTCANARCDFRGYCDVASTAFLDKSRPDFINFEVHVFRIGPFFPSIVFGAFILDPEQSRIDPGIAQYVGTLILDSSSLSRGNYVVSMLDDPARTVVKDEFLEQIPATLNPVTINFCDVLDSPNDCNGNSIPDECEADGDGDGVIDACDPCPLDAPDDSDGDGVCDSDDGCPTNPLKIVPGDCGCSNPEDDSDGDGVPDCVDLCARVDDAVFGEQCANAIPTVDSWGLIVLSLLLMVGGKLYFQRRPVLIHAR